MTVSSVYGWAAAGTPGGGRPDPLGVCAEAPPFPADVKASRAREFVLMSPHAFTRPAKIA